jgi:hypothetical protein
VAWPIIEFNNLRRLHQFQVDEYENLLQVNCPERWSSISIKSLVVFNYCLEKFDFDFLIRGNATSYFNIDKLRNYLEGCEADYLGPIQKNKTFATGWAIGMSRKALAYLVREFTFRNLKFFDDEAFGQVLMPRFGCRQMPYVEISNLQELETFSMDALRKLPAIRTKSLVNGTRLDSMIQQKLFQKFESELN